MQGKIFCSKRALIRSTHCQHTVIKKCQVKERFRVNEITNQIIGEYRKKKSIN